MAFLMPLYPIFNAISAADIETIFALQTINVMHIRILYPVGGLCHARHDIANWRSQAVGSLRQTESGFRVTRRTLSRRSHDVDLAKPDFAKAMSWRMSPSQT